jgi:hypothetical protein
VLLLETSDHYNRGDTLFMLPIFLLGLPLLAAPRPAVDNAYIRVFRPDDPYSARPRNLGLNRILVHLASCEVRLAEKNGNVAARQWNYGDVEWRAAGDATVSESVPGKPCKIVEIEIKDSQRWSPVAAGPLDPLAMDPRHYQLLLENDQVRVLRARFGPGEASARHHHVRSRFTVMLTDADLRPRTDDGRLRVLKGRAGDLTWVEGGRRPTPSAMPPTRPSK